MLARLILAFAVVLAPLGLFSAWSYQQLLSDRRDASRRDATESARTAAALVHGLLRDLDGTTLALAQGIGSRPLTEPLTQANVGSALAAVSQR